MVEKTAPTKGVRIGLLRYRNVIGVQDLEVAPGRVNEFTGTNGAGKSTTAKCLLFLIEGAKEATLTPKDGTVAEAVIVVNPPGGEDPVTFRRTVSEDGVGPLTAKQGNSNAPLPKPQELMRTLINGMGANPVKFLTSSEDEQLDWLLKAMPLRVTREQLGAVLGSELPQVNYQEHALTVIDYLYSTIYKTRTGVNISQKDAAKNAQRLRESLLPDDGTDYAAEVERIQKEFDSARAEWTANKNTITAEREAAIKGSNARAERMKATIQADLNTAIRELEKEYAKRTAAVDENLRGLLVKIENNAQSQAAEMESTLKPKGEKLSGELATAKSNAEASIRSQTTRQHYEEANAEAGQYASQAERLTAQLDGLDGLRKSLLTKFPIKGLEIRDGKIFHHGKPLSGMSSGEQIKLAIQVSALTAGEGGPIIVDDLEKLAPENFAKFMEIASKTSYQFFFTRVDSGPLKVTVHQ